MRSGQKYDVRVKVKNSGEIRWGGRPFALTSKIYKSPSRAPAQREELTPHIDLRSPVETGVFNTFDYDVVAPEWKGTYILEWTMSKGSSTFGDRVRITIKVS